MDFLRDTEAWLRERSRRIQVWYLKRRGFLLYNAIVYKQQQINKDAALAIELTPSLQDDIVQLRNVYRELASIDEEAERILRDRTVLGMKILEDGKDGDTV